MSALIFLMFGLFFILGVTVVLIAHHRHKERALTRGQHVKLQAGATVPTVPGQTAAEVQGEVDMIRAWLDFNCPPVWDPRPKMTTGIRDLIDAVPPMTAGRHVLVGYMTDCRLAADAASKNGMYGSLVTAMRSVAARLYLLGDDEFRTATGATSVKYLSHDNPAIAEAYIRGQLAGVEKIKKDIILAKDRARNYEQRHLGLTESSRTHDATLEALREIARPEKTEHQAWSEQFLEDGKATE